jgi:hypothetical protein
VPTGSAEVANAGEIMLRPWTGSPLVFKRLRHITVGRTQPREVFKAALLANAERSS